jgi:hypothetical protein
MSIATAGAVSFHVPLGSVGRVGRNEVAVSEDKAKVVNVLAVWHIARAQIVQPDSLWNILHQEGEVLCSPPDCTLKSLLVVAIDPPNLNVFGGVPFQPPDKITGHLELSAKVEEALRPLVEIGYLVTIKNIAIEDDVVRFVVTDELDDSVG